MQFKVDTWQLIKAIDYPWQQVVSLEVCKQPFSRFIQFSLDSFPVCDETECNKNTIVNHWLRILLYRTTKSTRYELLCMKVGKGQCIVSLLNVLRSEIIKVSFMRYCRVLVFLGISSPSKGLYVAIICRFPT